MKLLILATVLLLATSVNAQFAIIADKDGFVNVRGEAKTGNNIIDTLKNGHLIYCLENEGNWTDIDYSDNGKSSNGYVYKDRYIPVTKYTSIPVVQQRPTTIKLAMGDIEISIKTSNFDQTKHKITYHEEFKGQVYLIDDKHVWGADGGMPTMEYQSISIRIGEKIIELPQNAIGNLFQPNLEHTKANYDKATKTLYLQSTNSDGAGGYVVLWKITNGAYVEQYVTEGF